MPWSGDAPPFGFSSTAETWLPMPAEWAALTVQRQQTEPGSTLEFYRRAIQLRAGRAEFAGSRIQLENSGEVLTLRREGGLTCVLNTGAGPAVLPAGEVLLSSGELTDGILGPDSAVWLV
jgi:alpha-glucosidase